MISSWINLPQASHHQECIEFHRSSADQRRGVSLWTFARTKVALPRVYLQTPLYQERFSDTVNRPSKSWTVVRIQSLVLLRPEQRKRGRILASSAKDSFCCVYLLSIFLHFFLFSCSISSLSSIPFSLLSWFYPVAQRNPSSRFYHRNPEMGKHLAIKFSTRNNRFLRRHVIYSFVVLNYQLSTLTSFDILSKYPSDNQNCYCSRGRL